MSINVKWNAASYLATDTVQLQLGRNNPATGIRELLSPPLASVAGNAGTATVGIGEYIDGDVIVASVVRNGAVIATKVVNADPMRNLPGPKDLVSGDNTLGYFGEMRTGMETIMPWFYARNMTIRNMRKYVIDGRIIYIPVIDFIRTNAIAVPMFDLVKHGVAEVVGSNTVTGYDFTKPATPFTIRINDGLRLVLKNVHLDVTRTPTELADPNSFISRMLNAFIGTRQASHQRPEYPSCPTLNRAQTDVDKATSLRIINSRYHVVTLTLTNNEARTAAVTISTATSFTTATTITGNNMTGLWYMEAVLD